MNFLNNGNGGYNFGYIGAGIILIFILSWLLSTVIYRANRYDEMEARIVSKPTTGGEATLMATPQSVSDAQPGAAERAS